MINRSFLYKLLNKYASIKSDLIEKYPELKEKIEFLSSKDPSGSDKYLVYSVKTLASGQALQNEIADVIELFHRFKDKLDNKDIFSYNFTDLRDKLFLIRDSGVKSKRKAKNEIKTSGGQKIFEDAQCTVLLVKDKAAACFYGAGTKWCITMSAETYFEDYSAANVVFFFVLRKDLDKEDPNYKVAIVFQRDKDNEIIEVQYFDALDTESTSSHYLDGLKSKLKIIDLTIGFAQKEPKGLLAKLRNEEVKPEELTEKDLELDSTALYLIKQNQKISQQRLLKLYEDNKDDTSIIETILYYKYCPREIFDDLYNNGYYAMLVESYKTPPDILDKISKIEIQFAERVAINNSTLPETLRYIYNRYDDDGLRKSILYHNNVPSDILEEAVKSSRSADTDDDEIEIDYLVSLNPNLTPKISEEIYNKYIDKAKIDDYYLDTTTQIIYGLMRNKNCSKTVIDKIISLKINNTIDTLLLNKNLLSLQLENIYKNNFEYIIGKSSLLYDIINHTNVSKLLLAHMMSDIQQTTKLSHYEKNRLLNEISHKFEVLKD